MAQFPGVPWDQRPDYVALTQRVDPAGIVTAYNPPRPGVSATDVTSFVFGQATITRNSWPEVMYYLNPTPEWTTFRRSGRPQQKVDANNNPMFERFPCQGQPPRPLLDFPILPDTISSREELWWIELWRRMDPRIHWEDILMRIEVPNRTVTSDRYLQNSSNNLLNRQEHRYNFMLAWHTTGARGQRANTVRSMVLQRVATAQPPLPPNSTRGLTPGLINPALGNVPGNSVAQPVLGANQGRLRVGLGQGRGPQIPAPAYPALTHQALAHQALANPPQAPAPPNNPVRHNPVRDTRRRDNPVDSNKRRRTSPGNKGRPSKRQAREPSDDDEDNDEDSYMNTSADESDISEEIPLSVVKARAAKSAPAKGKSKVIPVKRKPSPEKSGKGKKGRRAATHTEVDDDQEDGGAGDSSAGPFLYEGDPGFERAFQASRLARRQAQGAHEDDPGLEEASGLRPRQAPEAPEGQFFQEGDPGFEAAYQASRLRRQQAAQQAAQQAPQLPEVRHAPRRPPRRAPTPESAPRELLSHTESQGRQGIEEAFQAARLRRQQARQAQAAPEGRPAPRRPPRAAPAPESVPQAYTSDSGSQSLEGPTLLAPSRPRPINPITGLPFLGPRRRPEALSGYGDRQTRRRSPAAGSSTRAAPSTSVRDNTMRPVATRSGFPVPPTMSSRPSVYAPGPDGMHYHFTDNSGIPAFARHFEPTNSHIGFTPYQRRVRAHQIPVPPPQPSVNPYSVPPPHQLSANPYLTPAPNINNNALTLPVNALLPPTAPPTLTPATIHRITQEVTRHNDALIAEIHRGALWPRQELFQHTRNVWDIMRREGGAGAGGGGYSGAGVGFRYGDGGFGRAGAWVVGSGRGIGQAGYGGASAGAGLGYRGEGEGDGNGDEDGEEDFATGFLEREEERERREREGEGEEGEGE